MEVDGVFRVQAGAGQALRLVRAADVLSGKGDFWSNVPGQVVVHARCGAVVELEKQPSVSNMAQAEADPTRWHLLHD